MNAETMQKLIYELQRHCDKIGRVEMAEANQLTTPAGIKFLATDSGLVSGLYFNDGKQCLSYCELTGQYEVDAVYCSPGEASLWPESECLPLTPCKYEDLKYGDIFFVSDTPNDDFEVGYKMKLPEKNTKHQYAYIEDGTGSLLTGSCPWEHYWKVGK